MGPLNITINTVGNICAIFLMILLIFISIRCVMKISANIKKEYERSKKQAERKVMIKKAYNNMKGTVGDAIKSAVAAALVVFVKNLLTEKAKTLAADVAKKI